MTIEYNLTLFGRLEDYSLSAR